MVFAAALAQQPFYTDDADVTEYRKFHIEFSNQYSWLQTSLYPNLRQNTAVFQINYGISPNLEIGIDSPLLVLVNAPGVKTKVPIGIGDTNFTVKWNFHREQTDSRSPALTVSFAIESPTGDEARQLGSGLADYGVNTVIQKHVGDKTIIRFNNGILFSGNTLTGVVGLQAQGMVYSSGASITRQVSDALILGVEVNGAIAQSAMLGKAALQTQLGAKYGLGKSTTLDLGVLVGRFVGSPRLGLQIGFSKDF